MNDGGSCDQCWCLSFFRFFTPDLSPCGSRNGCILVALCHLITERPSLEVATKRLPHQQVKIPVMLRMKYDLAAISSDADTFEVSRCPLLQQVSSQCGAQKLLQGLVSHEITFYLFDLDFFLTQLNGHIIKKIWSR